MSSNQIERLQEACQLNNAGAAFLAANEGGKALKVLKSALVIMEGISKDDTINEDLVMSFEGQGAANKRCPSSIEIPGLEDSFFIFNRAILIGDASSSGGEIDLAFSNAVILFNLALTFHQRGRTFGEEDKLRRAVYMYDLAIKLSGDMSVANSGALAMAALNNQAQIYNTDLCDYVQARLVLDQLRAFAEHVPIPDDDDSSCPIVREDLDEFYLNVTISQPPTTAPCA